MNQSVLLTVGDERYKLGDLVEFIVVTMDPRNGVARVQPGVGEIVEVHTESVAPCEHPSSPLYINRESAQFPMAAQPPPSVAIPAAATITPAVAAQAVASGTAQIRVTGFDLRLTSILCWAPKDVPNYYIPKSDFAQKNMINMAGGVAFLYVPARHVIRNFHNHTPVAYENVHNVLNYFFRRAPYGWNVLYNEPFISEEELASLGNDDGAIKQHTDQLLEDFCKKEKGAVIKTQRIIGEVLEFGIDYNGELNVIINAAAADSNQPPPRLDNYLFHGPFAETGRVHSDKLHLYKLPYRWIHDAYDAVHNGEQNYYNVLKHILCDTLLRYRVKTVKVLASEEGDNKRKQKSFYFGFTEDGFHFAKNNRHVLATEITRDMRSSQVADGPYEIRHSFQNQKWLNLRAARPGEDIHTTVKRGYIIYGRVVHRADKGQTTLEWCTPTPGLDLLRVYLVTNGQSPIFRNLDNAQILEKMKDRHGDETLASQLFAGLIDPEVRNAAIDYIRRELIW